MKCIVNGDLQTLENASIPVSDLTLRRGYGIFDFFRAYNTKCLYLEQHLERLYNGISRLRLSMGPSKSELQRQVEDLVNANAIEGTSGVRIVVTGGQPSDGFSPTGSNVIITQEYFQEPTSEMYSSGTKLISFSYQRELSDVKSINYLHAVYHGPEMKEAGAADILYHFNFMVSECARSNIFCIRDRELYTPASGILAGITRNNVLKIAERNGIPVRIQDFTLDFLMNSDEIFITSTIKRILPVTQIDGVVLDSGRSGPLTNRLLSYLQESDASEIAK